MGIQRKTLERLKFHAEFSGKTAENEGLAEHSTFRIGGRAALFIEPDTEQALAATLGVLKDDAVPFVILGGGSNVLFPDGDFDRAVISTLRLCGTTLVEGEAAPPASGAQSGVLFSCGAGTLMADALEFCLSRGAVGLESFAGLPGTAGGAVYMNARCYNTSISDTLVSVRYIDPITLSPGSSAVTQDDWGYKASPFQPGGRLHGAVITGAAFSVHPAGDHALDQARRQAEHCINDRRAKGHFDFPSAGSVFKNNRAFGKPTGRIIDEAGLRGLTEGDAQVAPWHGNLIINRGRAASRDVRVLIKRITESIREKTGFVLEPEIVLL
jgi:UDP-N-acetylmuramate dehydrogenase